jgi:hypothetical protein
MAEHLTDTSHGIHDAAVVHLALDRPDSQGRQYALCDGREIDPEVHGERPGQRVLCWACQQAARRMHDR